MAKLSNKNPTLSKKDYIRREHRLSFWLLLPTIVVFAVFMFWPVIYTVYLSFLKWNMISPVKTFVGFNNYVKIFKSTEFIVTLKNTGLYMPLFVVIDVVVPYIVSYCLTYLVKRLKGFYKVAIFVPSLISLVIGGLIMSWIWNSVSGPLATIWSFFGGKFPNWAATSGLVIVVISMVVSWKMFGYNVIVLVSAIDNVPMELIETAKIENTPNVEIFFKIVLPLTSAQGIYTLIISLVWGLTWSYTPLNILTSGGPNNLSTNVIFEVYEKAFTIFSTGEASALAVIALFLFIVFLVLEFVFVEKRVFYEN